MKVSNSHIRLIALVISFVFTNTALATESTTDESKDNGAGNTISNAGLTNSDAVSPVETQANTVVSEQQSEQTQAIDDAQSYRKEMDERRRQMQQAQDEAYKRHLERRKQYFANNPAPVYKKPEFENNVPDYIQERRNEFIKQMEERRALNVKMMEENRKAVEERRKAMQLKMYQTNTAAEPAEKA